MTKEHILEKKIYYHDTDAGGVVYYANYLKHLEEGRTEYCAARGIDTGALVQKGIYFVVAHLEIDYKASASYGQTVAVCTQVESVGRSSTHFLQTIKHVDKLLINSRVTWVCVNSAFKPISIPADIKLLFSQDL